MTCKPINSLNLPEAFRSTINRAIKNIFEIAGTEVLTLALVGSASREKVNMKSDVDIVREAIERGLDAYQLEELKKITDNFGRKREKVIALKLKFEAENAEKVRQNSVFANAMSLLDMF